MTRSGLSLSEIKSRDGSKPLENKGKRMYAGEGLGRVSTSCKGFNKSEKLLTRALKENRRSYLFVQMR